MDLSLSVFVTNSPANSKKLVLPSKSISEIDELPASFSALEILDLRHNDIQRLSGIRNFPKLRVLLLTHNCIQSLTEFNNLEALPVLEIADFVGNPVTSYFGYRDYVILCASRLTLLDDEEVKASDQQAAKTRANQRERLISAIVTNEETISKLEHLQRMLRVHTQLIAQRVMVDYTPLNLEKLLSWLELDWPISVTAGIRESLEIKVSERLHDSERDWKALYTECLERQQDFISSLSAACSKLSSECASQWSESQTHFRDWSLGPRRSGDFGLSTLGFELESVLNEHRELQELTEVQKQQLDAVIARNEELEGHLSVIRSRSAENVALHNTIDEGISIVVESFKNSHRVKKAFELLVQASVRSKQRRDFSNAIESKREFEVGNLCFAAWKWATKIEKFLGYREAERRDSIKKRVFRYWLFVIQRNLAVSVYQAQSQEKTLTKIVRAWNLLPLMARDARLKHDEAILQYSKALISNSFTRWTTMVTRHKRKNTLRYRDIHAEKLMWRTLVNLRTSALAARSRKRRATHMKNMNLAKNVMLSLRMMMFLTEKKTVLGRRTNSFSAKRALRRLHNFYIQRKTVSELLLRAEIHLQTTTMSIGIKNLSHWRLFSLVRKRHLTRLLIKNSHKFLRFAFRLWTEGANFPVFLHHAVSSFVCRRGIAFGKRSLRRWVKFCRKKVSLKRRGEVWVQKNQSKTVFRVFFSWLIAHNSSLRVTLTSAQLAFSQQTGKVATQEQVIQHLQATVQQLRLQIEEQNQSLEFLDTKRTLESHLEHTSRADFRKIQALETELTRLKTELAGFKGSKQEFGLGETMKTELASARALCTSLTAELQRTTNSLQSQQTEFHLQVNELTEKLTESRSEIHKVSKENRELKEKVRDKESTRESLALDISHSSLGFHTPESSRMRPEPAVSPRIDSEERRVRQQLENLKRERTQIRGEIETRLRDLDETHSASSPMPTLSSLGDLSSRLSQLETRMASAYR